MRGAVVALMQIVVAAVGIAAIGGLIGFLVVHFAHWGGAAEGFGWGMVIAGGAIALVTGKSGSPSDNFVRGTSGAAGPDTVGSIPTTWRSGVWAYWRGSSPLPQSPLQIALGALLAFAGGIAVFVLGQ